MRLRTGSSSPWRHRTRSAARSGNDQSVQFVSFIGFSISHTFVTP